MTEEKSWFNRFACLMDQNIRGVQYGVFTISGLALLVAIRTVRPFIKFVRPADIPKQFLSEKQSFIGKVIKVEYSPHPGKNPCLLVDHYPLIPLPWNKTNQGLPIEVASIEVTLNGLTWMQRVLVGDEISFTPLRIDNDRAHSIVFNKRRNVGQQLVSTGLATVSAMDFKLKEDTFYLKYYKSLLIEEEKAEVKRVGVWANSERIFIEGHVCDSAPLKGISCSTDGMIALPLVMAAMSNVTVSCLNAVADKYLKEKNLLLIGEEPPIKDLRCVREKTLLLYWGAHSLRLHRQPCDIIVNGVKNMSELHMLKSIGNVRGRIVVTVNNSQNLARRILSLLWNSNRITDVIVLNEAGSSLDVYTWFPYKPVECKNVKAITLLDTWRNGAFVKGSNLFPVKISRNLHGCELSISTRQIEPYVFAPKNGVFEYGYEVMIINDFQKTFNFSARFVPPPDFANFWSINSTNGTFSLLLEQKIDLVFGSIMARDDRYEKSEALYPHTIEYLVWTYPRPGYKTNFYSIYIVFSRELWGLILLFHILATVAFLIFYKRSNQRVGFVTCFFNGIAILCNSAYYPQPMGGVARIATAIYVVYALHLCAAYQSYLIFLLTHFERHKPIRELSQLVVPGTKAYLFKSGSVLYNRSDHETWNKILLPSNHEYIDGLDLKIFLHDMAINKSSILFFPKSSTNFITNLMYPDGGKSVFSHLNYHTCPLTMYLSPGSPLQWMFNDRLLTLIDTGIFPQWKKKILAEQAGIAQRTYNITQSPKTHQPLSTKHLEGTFLMWFTLLTFSTLTFLSEILWDQISSRYKKKPPMK